MIKSMEDEIGLVCNIIVINNDIYVYLKLFEESQGKVLSCRSIVEKSVHKFINYKQIVSIISCYPYEKKFLIII